MTNLEVVSQTQTIVVDLAGQTLAMSPGAASVSVINSGPQGPPGEPGLGIGGHDHVQVSESIAWTINHNLGYKPSVQMFNVGGLEVLGEIQHISNNQVTVLFNTPLSGYARLV
jgi:hypothetical protein